MGYDDEGRIFAVICLHLGTGTNTLGELNIEVTVMDVRGWTDQVELSTAADMGVMGQVWLSIDEKTSLLLKVLERIMSKYTTFPTQKKDAIKVYLHKPKDP